MPASIFTRARLDALGIAIQKGLLEVSSDGDTQKFGSLKELRETYLFCEQRVLDAEAGITQRARPSGFIRVNQSGTAL